MALSEKEQRVFPILHDDETQRNYFFKKVKDIKWFQPLIKEGFFDIRTYPITDTSKAKQGDNIAWIQLLYIEELITHFKDVPNHSYFNQIIEIVSNVINSSYYNDWVDYRINRILSLLPQDKIEIDLLKRHLKNLEVKSTNHPINDHIIVTDLFSAILKSGDLNKIKLIINEILEFKTYENSILGSVVKTKFDSSSIEYVLTKEYLSEYDIQILTLIYTQFIDILFPQMQELKDGTVINFKIGEETYSFKVKFTGKFCFEVIVSGKEQFVFRIEDYNSKTQEQVFTEVKKNFAQLDLSKLKLHDFIGDAENDIIAPFRRLYLESYNVSNYKFFSKEERYSSDDLTDLLKIVVRLIYLIHDKDEERSSILVKELLGEKYFFPFFKRASLSLICNNYEKHRNYFWDNIEKYNLLSDYRFFDDVYFLIDTNKEKLSADEIKKFVERIEVGPVTDNQDYYNQFKIYWQFKWYSLLKHIDQYNLKYKELKQNEVNKGKDFVWRPSGSMNFTGSKSPINLNELEQKSVSEIVNYLVAFRREERVFTAPDEEGLSRVLQQTVENNPVKFIKEIELFLSVHNTYVYALTDALESKVSENYNTHISMILDFYFNYINANEFTYEKQEGEDYFRLKPGESTIRILFRLLKKIVGNNSVKIKKADFNKLKKLLKLIFPLLKKEHYKDDPKKDSYIMFTINDPQGMFYELLLELSLREGRDYKVQNEKWQYKHYFDKAIEDSNDSALTVFGQYFNNFLWLDKKWALNKFKSLEIGSDPWQAFFGGHLPVRPVVSIIGYELIKPSYEYLIRNNINYSISGGYGIGNHLFILYYQDIVGLEKDGLIDLYFSQQNTKKTELVRAILRYEESLRSLQGEEKSNFENKITNLISFITDKLIESNEDYNVETLYSLFNLITMFEKLNSIVIDSLLTITQNVPLGNQHRRFVFHLVDNIKTNNTTEYANMLLQIYENLYNDLINISIYSHTIDIWDFIMEKAEVESHRENILMICKTFISRGEDRLEEYFTKLADKIKSR